MKNFQYKRFANVLRYLGFVKWRTYANLILIPLIITGAIILSCKYFIFFGSESEADKMAVAVVPMFFSIMVGFTSYNCVKMMSSTGHVGDAHSQFLALPASSLEKFVAAVIMRVFLPVICAFIGFYAAELITNPSTFGAVLSENMLKVSSRSMDLEGSPLLAFGVQSLAFLVFVSSMATFVFCGLLFSRFKWIIAFFVQVLCWIMFARIIYMACKSIDFMQYELRSGMIVLWLNIIFFVLSAVLFWGSYKLFERSQAVRGSFLAI